MRPFYLLLAVLAGCSGPAEPDPVEAKKHEPLPKVEPAPKGITEQKPTAKPQNRFRVKKVVDGDTIDLEDGRVVRYIGIDTPEKGMPYYSEAVAANKRMVEGKEIELELDVYEKEASTQWKPRTLGYIFVEEAGKRIFVNKFLLENGCAWYYKQTDNPCLKHDVEFRAAYEASLTARNGGWNLWLKEDAVDGKYYATKSGRPFHRSKNCGSLANSNPRNLIEFENKFDAFKSFHKPCRECYGK